MQREIHTCFSELVLALGVSNSTTSALKPPSFDGDSDPDEAASRDPNVILGAEDSVT